VIRDDGDGAQERVLQYWFENTYAHVVSIIPIFCGGITEGLEGMNVSIISERSATSKSFAKIGSISWPDLLIAWLAKREKHRGLRGIPSRI
jgi:hypothetical protein